LTWWILWSPRTYAERFHRKQNHCNKRWDSLSILGRERIWRDRFRYFILTMIELTPINLESITQYLEKATKIAEEVMIDYNKQFQLQKAIFYINIELAKINEIQAYNNHAIEKWKWELREEERKKHNTNRSTSESINKILQDPISDHNLNQTLIDKKIVPILDALIRIAQAVKDERINEMSQAKITGNFSKKEWY